MGVSCFGLSSGDKPLSRPIGGLSSSVIRKIDEAKKMIGDAAHSREFRIIAPSYPKGNPSPYNFTILETISNGNYTLAKIQYPDATNYEGLKILLVGMHVGELRAMDILDPHFMTGRENKLIARFEPTELGWELGQQMLQLFKP